MMLKWKKILILSGTVLTLAACAETTEEEPEETSTEEIPADTDELDNVEDTEEDLNDAEEPAEEEDEETSNDASDEATNISDWTMDDLVAYLDEEDVIDASGESAPLAGDTATEAIKYIDESLDLYYFDLSGNDANAEINYAEIEEAGYYTIQPSGYEVNVDLFGPFGIGATNSPYREQVLEAMNQLVE